MKTRYTAACVALIATILSGCDTAKSLTPTSPNLAGAVAGVVITAPKLVAPLADVTMTTGSPAITLVVDNATTTFVRPLSYTFQMSTDAAFATLVFAAEGVAPGANGRTSVEVTTALETGRTYHWRARALDGANTGPYSDVRQFAVLEPIVIAAPEPLDPVGGIRIATRQPTLRTRNATRTGPAGPITYDFHLSTSIAFDVTLPFEQAEQPTNTQVAVTITLEQDRTYYWRVRAREATTTGPWSALQSFVTPLPIVVPPPGNPPPPFPGVGFPSSAEGEAMVAFVIADLRARGINIQGDCGAFEVTKRVAWNFRHRGAGLERKTGGRRCEDASIDIVLWNDGRSIDILIGGGDDNGPAWQVHEPYNGWESFWFAPYDPDGSPAALLIR